MKLVILANGEFPGHPTPLSFLKAADSIVCCDGAAGKLVGVGLEPSAIVGDMDSLAPELMEKYASIIHHSGNQENNDLTKAFLYAVSLRPSEITILGATGLREDHTLGNISLLPYYNRSSSVPVNLYTNHGHFLSVDSTSVINAPLGSQVSIFSLDTNVRIVSEGLRYPLDCVIFDSWWRATLNETIGDPFKLIFDKARVIVYIAYKK